MRRRAARRSGQEVVVIKASHEREFDAAFSTLVQRRDGALLVDGDVLFNARREQLIHLAPRYRVPASSQVSESAVAAGLTMRRREFIALLATAATPRPVYAQAARRIVMLVGFTEDSREGRQRVDGFLHGLRELGWMEGHNISIEYRFASDANRTRAYASEAVALQPDLIVAHGNPFVAHVRLVNRGIPVVFLQVSDPVGSGFVDNIARPGGLVTGFTNFETEIGGKWMELLKEVAPHVTQALFLHHPQTAANVAIVTAAKAAAPALGMTVVPAGVNSAAEIEQAISSFVPNNKGGLIVAPHVIFTPNAGLVTRRAAEHRLPGVYPFQWFLRVGGLLSYGVDPVDIFRRGAGYVDKIFRGAKPSDLPVQNPSKYELAINLKTAKAIGLDIPPTLIARADEVIE